MTKHGLSRQTALDILATYPDPTEANEAAEALNACSATATRRAHYAGYDG